MHAKKINYFNRRQWLLARRKFLCSTDTAAIFGVGYKGASGVTVWAEKTERVPPDEDQESLRLEIGAANEKIALRLFEKIEGFKVKRPGVALFMHPRLEWMAASIDGTFEHPVHGECVVEAKWVSRDQMADWADDQTPIKFQVQVQHQLETLGLNMAVVVGLNEDDFMIRWVGRNQEWIDLMVTKLEEFWGHVRSGTQPPMDGSYATTQILQRLHPSDNGRAIYLPMELEEVADELADLSPKIKEAERREAELKNIIRAAIGDSTYGVLPDGRCFSWKTQDRAEHVVKASTSRVLRTHSRLPVGVDHPAITESQPERIVDGTGNDPIVTSSSETDGGTPAG